ncbi:MAG: 30S ribosomal protein S8 [Bacteroidetes bacterium]|nr:30S ribosomal protein S8 [Bacteroidota bacterium]
MSMSDPISDFLTRIRNAQKARHRSVDIPASKMKQEISRILYEKGYISKYITIQDGNRKTLRLFLKYEGRKAGIITGINRVSRPGIRRYTGVDSLPRVMNGLGIAILTTSKGILTDKEAKLQNVGGEVLCYVW